MDQFHTLIIYWAKTVTLLNTYAATNCNLLAGSLIWIYRNKSIIEICIHEISRQSIQTRISGAVAQPLL